MRFLPILLICTAITACGADEESNCSDKVDDDHDGLVDCDDPDCAGSAACGSDDTGCEPETWYQDEDGDGYGKDGATTEACEQPSGYADNPDDCNDGDPGINPDTTWYADTDNDGYGWDNTSLQQCELPSGYVLDNTDCDDSAADVNPGEDEQCDDIDHDCSGDSGRIDEDQDDWAICEGDCDDDDDAQYPGADEYCNGEDDDCDEDTDEDDALDAATWYLDYDGDSWGDPDTSEIGCDQPSGFVSDNTDCDDTDSTQYPGADEYCNDEDDDCDGTTDEDEALDASTWYADSDGDSYGDADTTQAACDQPSSYVLDNTDCDDADSAQYPGADEYCNVEDDDCDGSIDEDEALDASTWYADSDGDSYGDAGTTQQSCDQPSGFVTDSTDCDDTTATVNPGATETWYDGTDSDCDGASDYDQDGDGHDSEAYSGDDCDDTDSAVHPGASDTWYDGIDSDCDGLSDYDQDGDGYDSDDYAGTDCDDTDATTNPGADEVWYNGLDNDCAGGSDYDQDGDGHDSEDHGGEDCDDTDSAVSPSASDTWYDGIDSDCDGASDYDQDGDGYDSDSYGGTDCDDTVGTINPGVTEIWYDGLDYDCDGGSDYDMDGDGYDSEDYGGEDCVDGDVALYPGALSVHQGITMAYICPGTFDRGSPGSENGRRDEESRYSVELTGGFYIGIHEVTQDEFDTIAGYDNSVGSCTSTAVCPADSMTWDQAADFANAMSALEILQPCYSCTGSGASATSCQLDSRWATPYECDGYRLPTEAEWEYAARAGTSSAFFNGGSLISGTETTCTSSLILDDGSDLGDIAHFCGNMTTTRDIGQHDPNAWGLYDVHGNVSEKVHDGWDFSGSDYSGSESDPYGLTSSIYYRIIRGGALDDVPQDVRSARRMAGTPDTTSGTTGLRIARSE